MSRVPHEQMGAPGARALPPRLDPRAGRPPRATAARRSGSARTTPPAAGRDRRPEAGRARSAAAVREAAAPRFGSVLGLTALGALLPGSALIAAGARRVGWAILTALCLMVGVVLLLATVGRSRVIQWAVNPTALLAIIVAAVGLAVVWALIIIAGYRMLAPRSTTGPQHLVGTILVSLLAIAVAAPAFEVAHLASVQRSLIQNVFADGQSATVDPAAPNAFAGKDRVNVLLLGGDGGEGRDGVRTDTVMVASIATETGKTTLFSLPRNLEDLPFPEDSPLADVYPDGFEAGSESEGLLNAVYRNGPEAHPDILGPTDNPGADFLKLGVGEALGLHLDYYVLVNLDGFSALVDALGGITVNVNYYVPINGISGEVLPDDYIAPGPNQHMDGYTALQFARGRYGLTDYDRMARQRCTINAIVDAADPLKMLLKYQELAATTQDIVRTDIPQDVLGDFANLALKVKGTGLTSVVFDNSVITPAYPDYDEIRSIVDDTLTAPEPAETPTSPSSAAPAPTAGSDQSGDAETAGSGQGDPTAATSVTDACAYDPVRAQEALDGGEPPTRRG